jgi:ubiquinone biosynthesis protein
MRRFLVGVVVDALIVFVVLELLSLLSVPQPFPFGTTRVPIVTINAAGIWTFLAAGIAIGLVNRIVRPVVVAVTGRLVLSTMGAFLIVINAILLWIASLFVGSLAVTASPQLLWFLVIAAIYTLVAMLTGALLGLNIPDIDESGRGRLIWRILDAIPTPRRSQIIENVRLQQVYDTIYQFGLDVAIESTPVGRFRAAFQRRILGRPTPEAATPEAKLRMMLQQLGPTYVKLGQMAASRSEALPPTLVDELSKLQNDAAPFSWQEAETILVHELGAPVEERFATFEHEPFAAASTAQVHRATLPDGRVVAVKVQRPRIVAQTKADLGVLEELASVAERRFELAHRLGAQAMVREFASGVLKELDYENEAYHALRIAESMRVFPEIHIPVVDPSRSTSRVLTAEYVQGIKISDTEGLAASGVDSHHLGEVFIRAMIKQVLVDGFFHGDPHPGNVFVDPVAGRIIFLDFGLVGELRTDQRTTLIQLLLGLKAKDSGAIGDALIGLGEPGPDWDERAFRHDIDRVVRQHLIYAEVDSIGEGIGAVLGAVVNNGLRLDTDLTLAIKAVVQAEETARALSVNVDIAAAAFDQAKAAVFERLRGDAVEKFLSGQAIRVGQELLRRVPELESAAWSWLDQFGKGRLVVTIDTSDLNTQIAKVSDLGRQVAIGMLVTGQLIGTAILAAVLLQPTVSNEFQTFGYIGLMAFGVSLIVSMYVLFRQLRVPSADG